MKFRGNNKGIALISVMVLTTVCMLMATVIIEITYSSLISRRVNTRSDANFYSAERTIDELETVVQSLAIQATEDMASTPGSFVDAAEGRIKKAAAASGLGDTETIGGYMFGQLDYSLQQILGKEKKDESGNVVTDGSGNVVYEYDNTKFKVSAVKKKEGTATTKGTLTFSIEFSYQNPDTGYLTSLSTDLVMHDVTYRKPASAFPYGSYSMFTGAGANFQGDGRATTNYKVDGADLQGLSRLPTFFQEGNTYYGGKASSTESTRITSDCCLCLDGDKVIINGDVYIENGSVLMFTGKRNVKGKVIYPEVDVRGTIYIYPGALLVVSEGCDVFCNDIIFTESGKSFWDTSVTEQSDKFGTWGSWYPYTYATKDAIMKSSSSEGNLNPNWAVEANNNRQGMVVYRTESESKVLNFSRKVENPGAPGTYTSKFALNGVETASINLALNRSTSGSFLPYAKASFWTYDNKSYQVDSELANFMNLPLVYYKMSAPTSALTKEYMQTLNYLEDVYEEDESGNEVLVEGTESKRTDVDILGQGGNSFSLQTFNKISKDAGQAGEMISSSNGEYDDAGGSLINTVYSGMSDGSGVDSGIPTDGNVINNSHTNVEVMVSPGSAANKYLTAPSADVILYDRFDDYTIALSSGSTIMGMFISADIVTFKAHGHGTSVVYSLLNAKDISEQTADMVDDVVKFIKYSSNMKSQAYENYGKYAYAVCSINSDFKNGYESLFNTDAAEDNGTGSVSLSVTNMYDFVSIENWHQN